MKCNHMQCHQCEDAEVPALRVRLAEVERERDNLRACNEAMRLLRELVSMPTEGESAVVERVIAMFRAAERREARLRKALEREAMVVSMERTWCSICRTEHFSLDPKRVHPHDARCPLFRDALAPAPEARKAPAVRFYPTKEQNRNWQCSGCHWAFAGPWQKVCPACGLEDYWTGSVEPHAALWPHGTEPAPSTELGRERECLWDERERHTNEYNRIGSALPALVDQVREEERAACEAIARHCVEKRNRQASQFPQHDERRTWLNLKASEAERIADAIRARRTLNKK